MNESFLQNRRRLEEKGQKWEVALQLLTHVRDVFRNVDVVIYNATISTLAGLCLRF